MACPRILLALLLVVHIKTHAQLILPGASQPIVFGDSLSDDGNTFNITGGLFPPLDKYWQGRFTSAPGTWTDIVRLAGLPIDNRAYGAATACFYPDLKGKQSLVPPMVNEVDKWLANKTRSTGPKVVVLWGGHNDLLSAVRLNVSEALKVPANTVECLIGMANKLLKADDNITVIVATLAPIDMTPALRIIPLVGTLIGSMNTGIKAGVASLRLVHGLKRTFVWDLNQFIADAIVNYRTLNFTNNNTVECLPYTIEADTAFRDLNITAGDPCKDPNAYLFYDPIHPSSRGHLNIAIDFIQTLQDRGLISGVPSTLNTTLTQLWANQTTNTTRRMHRRLLRRVLA